MTPLEPMQSQPLVPRNGDWRPADTHLARAAAALLICNSHLEAYYPRSWMAGDGLMGNSMFFFLSGFGVALASSSRSLDFFSWMQRRMLRLYPAVILSVLVIQLGLLQGWRTLPLADYPRIFLYPTTYGFVGQIMIVYVLLYKLLRAKSRWPHVGALVAMTTTSVILYIQLLRHGWPAHAPLALGNPATFNMQWFYFTSVGLLGGLLSPITRHPRQTLVRDLSMLVGIFGLYLVTKLAMTRGVYPRCFILLFLMTIGICVVAVRVSASDEIQSLLRRVNPVNHLIALLSGITLEMYIMQFWTTGHFGIQNLRFPLNLAVFWIATLCSAIVLSRATALIMRWGSSLLSG